MKKKTKKIIIFVLTLLFILIGILFIIFKEKSINSNSNLINDIYRYIGNNDLQVCSGLSAYNKEKVEFDDLKNTDRLCMSYSLIDKNKSSVVKVDKRKKNNTCSVSDGLVFATDNYEDDICTLSKIDAKIVEEEYKSVYGKSLEKHESFQYDNATICQYEKSDNSYYCGLSETFTHTIGAEQHTYRSIAKAKENGNKIIIYDYFLKTIDKKCYTSFTENVENSKCTNNYTDKINYKFLKKYGSYYKHTFEKDKDDNYYWVSSEPVK